MAADAQKESPARALFPAWDPAFHSLQAVMAPASGPKSPVSVCLCVGWGDHSLQGDPEKSRGWGSGAEQGHGLQGHQDRTDRGDEGVTGGRASDLGAGADNQPAGWPGAQGWEEGVFHPGTCLEPWASQSWGSRFRTRTGGRTAEEAPQRTGGRLGVRGARGGRT